jgi:peptide/nickel transport system ATP-binding protein
VSAAPALVEVVDLDVSYRSGEDRLRVLHGVSFSIGRGEAFGLVGESGCGKSTVARQLLGYRPANSVVEDGRVLFEGTDLLRLGRPALDRLRGNRVGFVPQDPTTALSPGMRVGAQVAEVLTFHDAFRGGEETRVTDLFRLVGLPDPEAIGRRYPHQLSGGQQQRVCIAMALACEPALVVLDEPTTGLDVTTQERIVELLAALRGRLGMSMLYVTHDLGVLAQIADRVGVMYAGWMMEIAPTATLFAAPRHPYTRGLIASVPQIDDAGRLAGRALRGLLKRDELPVGCPFQPRCDFADAECATEVQRLEAVADKHAVACRRWRALAPPTAVPASDLAPAPDRALSEPVLRLENVTLGYGGGGPLAGLFGSHAAAVVQDLSFSIEAAETFALVGESGSGKSTVARAVSGLLAPRAGRILFEGEPLPGLVEARSRALRRRIQYVFQNPDASLNPRARIGAILARPLQLFFDLDRRTIAKRVARALEDVRLDAGYAGRYPDQLSGGERQRVAVARALVAESTLLICDEILSALDVSVQANVLALLQQLRRKHRLSMLFISHDLAVVRNLADRVGVLFRGRLMESGGVEEVFAPPFHPYTHELLMAAPSLRIARRRAVRPTALKPVAATPGCVFAGRCPWQVGRICEEQPPPWRDAAAGHRIRCHIPLDELAGRAEWRVVAQDQPERQREAT